MPTKKTPEDIQLAMQSLQANFKHVLSQRTDFFSQVLVSICENDFSQLPDVISKAHQLAGSCGSFGLHFLGRLARQIEVNALLISDKTDSDVARLNLCEAINNFIEESNSNKDQPVTFQSLGKALNAPNTIQSVWFVLSDSNFRSELELQLTAFDFTVRSFSSYAECSLAIKDSMPGLLFCETQLAGDSLFSQHDLLDCIVQNKTKLMLCSKDDDFETRINAVRHQAQAFFVGQLDSTRILQRIIRLFDEMNFVDKKVSILDDDSLLAEHYSWILGAAGIEVQVIESAKYIIQDLLSFKPDLLLLDMHMPDYSGPDVSGLIRQYDQLSSLHITFLSAEHDIHRQLQALSYGADDFLTKPISNQHLVSAVKLRLARNRDIKSMIECDSLTGLVRHGSIKDTVYTEFEKMKRNGQHFCVAMVDLDHFKSVNDSHGHAVGDIVISTIAALLQKRLRRSDRAGRYGGEEFLVVLPDCSVNNAKRLLESLLDSFKNIQFSGVDRQFTCTFSAGLVCSSNGLGDGDTLIEAADQALYQAKHNGRNQVSILADV